MDEVKFTDLDIHIKANSITINGKKPTKSFLSQVPLECPPIDVTFTYIGWINMTFENKNYIEGWINKHYYINEDAENFKTMIYIVDGVLKRSYISNETILKLKAKQIYI